MWVNPWNRAQRPASCKDKKYCTVVFKIIQPPLRFPYDFYMVYKSCNIECCVNNMLQITKNMMGWDIWLFNLALSLLKTSCVE